MFRDVTNLTTETLGINKPNLRKNCRTWSTWMKCKAEVVLRIFICVGEGYPPENLVVKLPYNNYRSQELTPLTVLFESHIFS